MAIALIVALIASVTLIPGEVGAHTYTFGSESVAKGYTADASNRNSEDGLFETLTEGDQYSDTNFSGSSESVTTGTAGSGSFPSALDTDDGTRRTYTEADTASGSPTYQVLRPTSDGDVTTMVEYPVSPTTHYDKVDETTAGGDGDTSYLEGVSNSQESELGMANPSDPGGSPNIDVTMWHISRGESTSSCTVVWGIEIGGTEYQGGSTSMTSTSYTNYSYEWTLDPSDSNEWTLTDVSGLECYIRVTDANPDTRTTQIGLLVEFNPSATYQLDATITYSSVTSTSQTTGYAVYCQGYRSASENFGVYAWDYTGLSWTLKTTIQAASDTDYNFDLASTERDGTNNEVKLRLVDASGGDAAQDIVYLDMLKVRRIEKGYEAEMTLTASTVPSYGDLWLYVKAKQDGENFYVDVYDYTAVGWDTAIITISSSTNTMYDYDLTEADHRSGQEVKIRFRDATAGASDQTVNVMSLDYAGMTHLHADPTATQDGCDSPKNVGSTMTFWVTYTDADNDAPSYVKVDIGGTQYAMTENNSGDTVYWDGKGYFHSTSSLTGGTHSYHFDVKDANSGEVSTTPKQAVVNRAPTLTLDGVVPTQGNAGETTFSFYVTYTDLDNDAPSLIQAFIDPNWHNMAKNSSGDTDYTDGCAYHWDQTMPGGTTDYRFQAQDYMSAMVQTTIKQLDVNNEPTLSSPTIDPPAGPYYVDTVVTYGITYTDADNELPSEIWLYAESMLDSFTPYAMTEVDGGDTDVTDGKLYELYWDGGFSHGSLNYYFNASDGKGGWAQTDTYNMVVTNRPPTITNGPGDPVHQYRSTYWEYTFYMTDADGDDVTWAKSGNASFLTIQKVVLQRGKLYGTTPAAPGWFEVTVYCNDSYEGSDDYHFHFYVDNRAPVISSAGNTTQTAGTFLYYHVIASDDDGDPIGYELSTNASWASIIGEYVQGTAAGVGWYEFTVWANDSYGGSDEEHWHLTVEAPLVNDPPYFTSDPITTVPHATAYLYDADATDPEADPLTFALEGNGTAFLQIGASNGTVWGTPPDLGWWYVNISVADSEHTVWQNFTLTATNTAPSISTTPGLTGEPLVEYTYDANANDVNGDTLVWSVTEKPEWLNLETDTGYMSGTPTLDGSYQVKLVVTDAHGAMDWQNWTIVVTTPPVPPPPAVEEPNPWAEMAILLIIMVVFIMALRPISRGLRGIRKK